MYDSPPLQRCDKVCEKYISISSSSNPAASKQSKKGKIFPQLRITAASIVSQCRWQSPASVCFTATTKPPPPPAWPVLIMLYLMVHSLCQPCVCWAVLITRSTWWSAGTDAHQTQAGWFTTSLWYADAPLPGYGITDDKMLNGSLKMMLIGWEWGSGRGQEGEWGRYFFE